MIRRIALAAAAIALLIAGGAYATRGLEEGRVRAFLERLREREAATAYDGARVLVFDGDKEIEFQIQQDGEGGRRVVFKGMRFGGKAPEWGGWGGRRRGEAWWLQKPWQEPVSPVWGRDWPREPREGGEPHGPRGGGWGEFTDLPGELTVHDAALAAANYRLDEEPGPAEAGRETRRVTLRPRIEGRSAYRLLVDGEKGIPLRLEVRSAGRDWRVVFRTASIDFAARPKGLAKTASTAPSTDVAALAAQVGFAVARPEYVPAGFRLVSASRWRLHRAEGVASLTYSDGLATFRVLSSTRPPWWRARPDGGARGGPVPVARCRRGAFTEYGLELDGVNVTVMGAIPEAELEEVTRSLVLAR
jgi:hypothetical protein